MAKQSIPLSGLLPEVESRQFEYYPILLPDDGNLERFSQLNEVYALRFGLSKGQLVKRAHISLDGKITVEDDAHIIEKVNRVVSTFSPIAVQFGEVQYFPYWKNVILYLSIQDHTKILQLNSLLMAELMAKPTRLKPHLTLARNVAPEMLEQFKNPDLQLPESCILNKVAILKKPYKSNVPYKTIAILPIGSQETILS